MLWSPVAPATTLKQIERDLETHPDAELADLLSRRTVEWESMVERQGRLLDALQEWVTEEIEWQGETVASMSWLQANLESLERQRTGWSGNPGSRHCSDAELLGGFGGGGDPWEFLERGRVGAVGRGSTTRSSRCASSEKLTALVAVVWSSLA